MTIKRSSPYASALSASFDQQHGVLLQQARYLADQIPNFVTSTEWTAIGFASALNSDLIGAEIYYRRGIDAALDPTYQLSAIVAYAWFLFMQGRPEEAREQYKKGLSQRIQNDNFARVKAAQKVHQKPERKYVSLRGWRREWWFGCWQGEREGDLPLAIAWNI